MRIAVIGGGPAGLYFGQLWKRRHPYDSVVVFERNPMGVTWGFGVVFSDRALDFLRDGDPATYDLVAPHLVSWSDIMLCHRGETIRLDGVGFSAIGRLHLLRLLQAQAAAAGVELHFERTVLSLDEVAGCDLIVGADGLNSIVRQSHAAEF